MHHSPYGTILLLILVVVISIVLVLFARPFSMGTMMEGGMNGMTVLGCSGSFIITTAAKSSVVLESNESDPPFPADMQNMSIKKFAADLVSITANHKLIYRVDPVGNYAYYTATPDPAAPNSPERVVFAVVAETFVDNANPLSPAYVAGALLTTPLRVAIDTSAAAWEAAILRLRSQRFERAVMLGRAGAADRMLAVNGMLTSIAQYLFGQIDRVDPAILVATMARILDLLRVTIHVMRAILHVNTPQITIIPPQIASFLRISIRKKVFVGEIVDDIAAASTSINHRKAVNIPLTVEQLDDLLEDSDLPTLEVSASYNFNLPVDINPNAPVAGAVNMHCYEIQAWQGISTPRPTLILRLPEGQPTIICHDGLFASSFPPWLQTTSFTGKWMDENSTGYGWRSTEIQAGFDLQQKRTFMDIVFQWIFDGGAGRMRVETFINHHQHHSLAHLITEWSAVNGKEDRLDHNYQKWLDWWSLLELNFKMVGSGLNATPSIAGFVTMVRDAVEHKAEPELYDSEAVKNAIHQTRDQINAVVTDFPLGATVRYIKRSEKLRGLNELVAMRSFTEAANGFPDPQILVEAAINLAHSFDYMDSSITTFVGKWETQIRSINASDHSLRQVIYGLCLHNMLNQFGVITKAIRSESVVFIHGADIDPTVRFDETVGVMSNRILSRVAADPVPRWLKVNDAPGLHGGNSQQTITGGDDSDDDRKEPKGSKKTRRSNPKKRTVLSDPGPSFQVSRLSYRFIGSNNPVILKYEHIMLAHGLKPIDAGVFRSVVHLFNRANGEAEFTKIFNKSVATGRPEKTGPLNAADADQIREIGQLFNIFFKLVWHISYALHGVKYDIFSPANSGIFCMIINRFKLVAEENFDALLERGNTFVRIQHGIPLAGPPPLPPPGGPPVGGPPIAGDVVTFRDNMIITINTLFDSLGLLLSSAAVAKYVQPLLVERKYEETFLIVSPWWELEPWLLSNAVRREVGMAEIPEDEDAANDHQGLGFTTPAQRNELAQHVRDNRESYQNGWNRIDDGLDVGDIRGHGVADMSKRGPKSSATDRPVLPTVIRQNPDPAARRFARQQLILLHYTGPAVNAANRIVTPPEVGPNPAGWPDWSHYDTVSNSRDVAILRAADKTLFFRQFRLRYSNTGSVSLTTTGGIVLNMNRTTHAMQFGPFSGNRTDITCGDLVNDAGRIRNSVNNQVIWNGGRRRGGSPFSIPGQYRLNPGVSVAFNEYSFNAATNIMTIRQPNAPDVIIYGDSGHIESGGLIWNLGNQLSTVDNRVSYMLGHNGVRGNRIEMVDALDNRLNIGADADLSAPDLNFRFTPSTDTISVITNNRSRLTTVVDRLITEDTMPPGGAPYAPTTPAAPVLLAGGLVILPA
jgi:hypothetical protein